MIYSKVSSETNKASPPDNNTSLTCGVLAIYSIALSILSIGIASSLAPANLLRVQCLQYIEHISVINRSTLSGYLWVNPGTGESSSSCNGSKRSASAWWISFIEGIACFLTGQLGSLLSINEK